MNFLNLLDKLGRKRIVMDRGASHPEFHLAKPWTIDTTLCLEKDLNGFHSILLLIILLMMIMGKGPIIIRSLLLQLLLVVVIGKHLMA